MASSVPSAWRDADAMTANELSAELTRTRSWLERTERKIADMDPIWLHHQMDEDDVDRVFAAAKEKITAERMSKEMEGSPDLLELFAIPFIVTGMFFVTGPYSETDAQVADTVAPPSGSYHYQVHLHSETAAPNQLAPPEVTVTNERAVWTVYTDDTGVAVEMGILYLDDLYDDIQGVVRANRPPEGELAIPVATPEASSKSLRRQETVTALSERVRDLEAALDRVTSTVNLVIVRRDARLPVLFHDGYRLPRPNEYGATVGEVFGCIGIRNGKDARIFIGNYTLVDNESLYDDFLARMIQTRPQPATVLVIEPPPAEEEEEEIETPEGKRRRSEGALVLLHEMADNRDGDKGADTVRLAVALLPAMKGLVVVNRDTKQRVCEHVHPLDVEALSALQHSTGRACPQCAGGGGGG